MGLPQLETCCFVFDLKSGNIIMGCLSAFFSLVLTIVMIVAAASLGTVEENKTSLPLDLEEEAALTGLYAMSIILVIMFLLKFLFDVMFIYGVAYERPTIIRAYFFMWVVFFLLSMFTFSVNATHYGAATICTELFYIGLNIYAILLSNSFYKHLNTREEV